MAQPRKRAAKKEVATRETTELVQAPAHIKQGGNRGSENVTNEDLQLPRINIIQDLSPQKDEDEEQYIPGSAIGDLFNTLTGQLYDDNKVTFTPITFQKRWFVWKDQDEGGGLQGIYDFKDEVKATAHAEQDETFEAVLTHEHLVLLLDGSEVILSCAKSKLKVSKKFNSLIRLNGGDRFGRNYELGVVRETNKQNGKKYYNFTVNNKGGAHAFPNEERYEQAEGLYSSIVSGTEYGGDYDGDLVVDTNPDY